MINIITTNDGKIWKRRSKNLKTGTIECNRCGKKTKVSKFTDIHFEVEYYCGECKKDLREIAGKTKSTKVSGHKPKTKKIGWAIDCPHKPFFNCKSQSECISCYYNPDKKIALMKKNLDDPKKNAKDHWFYGNKSHSKKSLKILEDIRLGRGLQKGGNRAHFKFARKNENN